MKLLKMFWVVGCYGMLDAAIGTVPLYQDLHHIPGSIQDLQRSFYQVPRLQAQFTRFWDSLTSEQQNNFINLSHRYHTQARNETVPDKRRALFNEYKRDAAAWSASVGGAVLNKGDVWGTTLWQLPQFSSWILKTPTFLHNKFNVATGFFNKPWGNLPTEQEWAQFDAQKGSLVQLISRSIASARAQEVIAQEGLTNITVAEDIPVALPFSTSSALDDANVILFSSRMDTQCTPGISMSAIKNKQTMRELGFLAAIIPLWDINEGNFCTKPDGTICLYDLEQPNNLCYLLGEPRNVPGGGIMESNSLIKDNVSVGTRHFLNLAFNTAPIELCRYLKTTITHNAPKDSAVIIKQAMHALFEGFSAAAANYFIAYPHVMQQWNETKQQLSQ